MLYISLLMFHCSWHHDNSKMLCWLCSLFPFLVKLRDSDTRERWNKAVSRALELIQSSRGLYWNQAKIWVFVRLILLTECQLTSIQIQLSTLTVMQNSTELNIVDTISSSMMLLLCKRIKLLSTMCSGSRNFLAFLRLIWVRREA